MNSDKMSTVVGEDGGSFTIPGPRGITGRQTKSDNSKRGATNSSPIFGQYFPKVLETHFLMFLRPFGHLIFCS